MTEDRLNYLKDIVNTDYQVRHDIPQMHFTLNDLMYLVEQTEKAKRYESALKEIADCDEDTPFSRHIILFARRTLDC